MQADQKGSPCRCQKRGEQGYWGQVPAHVMWRSGQPGAFRPLFWAATACSMCMQVMELIKSKHCNPILVRLAWHDSGTYDKVNCPAGRLTCSVPARSCKTRLSALCQPQLHSCAECVCSSWSQHSPAVWGMCWQHIEGALRVYATCIYCRTSLSGPSVVEPMGL